MRFKNPKDTQRILWTKHAKEKMRFYQLSERKLRKLIRNPDRKEEGIVPGTVALMQKAGSKKNPYEIWLMYQKVDKKIKIITAWCYPGISPKGIPLPEDEDLKEILG